MNNSPMTPSGTVRHRTAEDPTMNEANPTTFEEYKAVNGECQTEGCQNATPSKEATKCGCCPSWTEGNEVSKTEPTLEGRLQSYFGSRGDF